MRVIGLAVVLAVGLTLAPLGTAAAQPREKVPRVGYLTAGSHSDQGRQRRFEAFRQGLRDLGYVEGQNIAIESRSHGLHIHESAKTNRRARDGAAPASGIRQQRARRGRRSYGL